MSNTQRNSALQFNLSQLLEKKGMRQVELARRTGMSPGAIADLISGKNALPTYDNLVAICDALDITKLDQLIHLVPKGKRE